MSIDTKGREALKNYFIKNSIPTQQNFADLIDAGLNAKDDGISKQASSALRVVAATGGAAGSRSGVLEIFRSTADPLATWSLSLSGDPPAGGLAAGSLVVTNSSGKELSIEQGVDGLRLKGKELTFTGAATFNGSLTVSGNNPLQVARIEKLGTAYPVIEQEDWTEAALINGWTRFQDADPTVRDSPPAYFKDACGIVHLQGVLTPPGGPTATSTIPPDAFKLPAAYVPATRQSFIVHCLMPNGAPQPGRVVIGPDGVVQIVYAPGRVWVSLNGVAFRASPRRLIPGPVTPLGGLPTPG